MQYLEELPDKLFSNHIESYWSFETDSKESTAGVEMLLPTCTFNIIFNSESCTVEENGAWKPLKEGTSFFGQRNSCLLMRSEKPIRLFGIRFKPFAFSHLLEHPIFQWNDRYVPLSNLIDLDHHSLAIVDEINTSENNERKFSLLNEFMLLLFKSTLSVDEKLRAQLNYIMDRRGSLQINELISSFGTNKVTLRKHFINKVGLTPKKVAKIWRMNYLLDMRFQHPSMSLTELSLMAGFYDQAHFIREFKQLFNIPPRTYFHQNVDSLRIAQLNISKRFGNQYDPR